MVFQYLLTKQYNITVRHFDKRVFFISQFLYTQGCKNNIVCDQMIKYT